MGGRMDRDFATYAGITASTTTTNSTKIDMSERAGLVVYPKATSGGLNVYAASSVSGTFVPLNDKDGTAISLGASTLNEAHVVNPEVFPVGALCLVAATTATTFDADVKS